MNRVCTAAMALGALLLALPAVNPSTLRVGVPSARADTAPNPWDASRDPVLAGRYAVHLRARELMVSASSEQIHEAGIARSFRSRARMLLEEAHADTSPDPALRFDLGEVCYELEDNACTIAVLEPALARFPDHPAGLVAYAALANAYAKLDRSADERRVYERYLPRITDDSSRAVAMLNLSEADMHDGALGDAVEGYRATIDAAAELPNVFELREHTGLLGVWGLAVALDRLGDEAGGAKEVRLALQLDRDMGVIGSRNDPTNNVFFSPERERDWYVALGFAEYAKAAPDPRAAALLWNRAEICWRDYIDDVRRHTSPDRWITLAQARLEKTHAQRVAVERRVKGRIAYPQYDCVVR